MSDYSRKFSMNISGFSLIETMVVIAILSIVSIAMSSMLVNFNKQSKVVEQRLEIMSYKNLFLQIIQDTNKCACQFGTNTTDTINTAEDGEAAWDLIRQHAETKPFDLVLCDWNMPKLTGIELLENIRAHSNPKIKYIKFIMITGAAEKIKEAMDQFADSIITKPFSAEDLKKKLQFILRS